MATGIQHATASQRGAILLAAGVTIVTGDFGIACVAGWGCLFGIACSPDLDIREITWSERVVFNLFGKAGWLWYLFWLPYANLIRHRHFISHAPILGTAVRLAIMLWLPLLLFWRSGGDAVAFLLSPVFLAFAGGLAFSDLLHWAMDYL